jgi:hypothetical protein
MISGAVLADDAGLLRCRGIPDAGKRLACYDALVVPAGDAKAVPGQPQQTRVAPVVPQQTRAAPGDLPQAADRFGMETRAPKDELQAVESRIPGHFEGWEAKSRIKLANGQVWQIADDSNRYFYLDNPKVTIRRGVLGAFYLEIEGSNITARVRRVQ